MGVDLRLHRPQDDVRDLLRTRCVLYACVPASGRAGNLALFVLFYVIILTMYGGGFATIPAYLRDLFGMINVGAIHGRLLTAWAAAGVAGPVLVNYIRQYQIKHGVAKADAYNTTMYIMAGLLMVGFICNFFVKSVSARFHMTDAEDETRLAGATAAAARV